VIAGLIGIFISIVTVVFWIVLSLIALLFLCLFLWVIFHRYTPDPTNEVPLSLENTPPPKEVPPPSPEIVKSSENVLPIEDINKINFIQIIPSSCCLSPHEEKIFKVQENNKMGAEVNPTLIQWQATGGSIDSQGKLIVDPRSKGTFHITATSRVDRLTSSANYTVLPRLTNIEIITTKKIVIPGQDVYLELRGADQTGAEINIEGQPIWSTTSGEVISKRKLVVDLPNRIVYITAKISGLEAKTTIRVGDRPQKVVNPIYPIDIPNPIPKTTPTPTPNQISIPIVPEHDPEDELSTNEPEQIKESSRLVALEIDAPALIFLKPSQERVFIVHGIDQFEKYIDPGKILWRATGGTIDAQGRLIVENDAKGIFRVTAISGNDKVSQHRLRQNLLLIKISLKIFSWILSYKRFLKDTASYFIQDFFDSELLVNEIFPDIDTSNIDGLLTVLVFDDIKDWVIEAAINIIIDYLDKFISLCFAEDFDPLVCYKFYIVLPELKSQESLKVIETVRNSSGTLNNNSIQYGSVRQRLQSPLVMQSPSLRTNIRQDIYLAEPYSNDILTELKRIRIVSYHKTMNSGNTIQLKFKLLGTDQNRKRILIKSPIIWKTTDGYISSTGRLIVNDVNNIIQVTATVGQLEAKTDMRSYRRHYTKLGTFTQY
jgi:hypothetical protein